MPLTEEEKTSIRFHLGYPLQTALRSMHAGLPFLVESNWQINQVLENVEESSIPKVRDCLKQCEDIMFIEFPESRLMQAAEKLGELTLRITYPAMLNKNYQMWRGMLATCLCVPINVNQSGVSEQWSDGPTNFRVRS